MKPLWSLLQSRRKSLPTQLSKNSWLIVGLGNPGPNYLHNRHNIGQQILNELAREFSTEFRSHRTQTQLAEFRLASGDKLLLAKSNGFMNQSGAPVAALLKFFSLETDRLIVIHDELDLDFGDIRLKFDGGHAGHNGLRDISAKCGSDYHRVRFGIGRPTGQQPVADFVLNDFNKNEQEQLPSLIARSIEIVTELIDSKHS